MAPETSYRRDPRGTFPRSSPGWSGCWPVAPSWSTAIASGGEIAVGGWTAPKLEPEIAIHLGPGGAGVAAVGAAIEVADLDRPRPRPRICSLAAYVRRYIERFGAETREVEVVISGSTVPLIEIAPGQARASGSTASAPSRFASADRRPPRVVSSTKRRTTRPCGRDRDRRIRG